MAKKPTKSKKAPTTDGSATTMTHTKRATEPAAAAAKEIPAAVQTPVVQPSRQTAASTRTPAPIQEATTAPVPPERSPA